MVEIIAEYFGVISEGIIPPDTLAELIPYLLTVLIGVALICRGARDLYFTSAAKSSQFSASR